MEEDNQSPNNIANDTWSKNVKEVVKSEIKILFDEITCLREEVRYLKETNIQLIHLLTNINLNPKDKKEDNKKNDQKVFKCLNNPDAIRNSEKPETNLINNRLNMETNLKSNKTIEETPKGAPVHKSYEDKRTGYNINKDPENTLTNKRKQSSNNNTIKGIIGANKGNTCLKAATKTFQIFVSRLHPSTTTTDLQTYLNTNFPESKCEELRSKFPDHYKSFKISIDELHREQVMDPNFWPSGIFINKFFRKAGQLAKNSG